LKETNKTKLLFEGTKLLIFLPRKRQQRSTPLATFSSLEGTQES